MTDEKNRLILRIVVPDAPEPGALVEVRPVVDGVDILAEAFTEGPGQDPKYLLPPDGPLTADAVEPREVRLAEAQCTEGCCGALYVTVRRDGDEVIWGGWRNPDDDEVDLPEFRFDAGEYRAEVERAAADHSWEWPARTVARLLTRHLAARTDWLSTWDCELGSVSAWLWEPDRINLFFFHPSTSAIREDRPWLQFRMVLALSGEDPAAQAEGLALRLTAGDPRPSAEVCGGSVEFARQLGYAWPRRG
ncbi:hypothetical protein ABZW32_25090 [Streptomyces sp. NPDC004667]|uniref:hypothetical protein n=1 Tax=Streptomyces sp. NPDC004667 TaxID=3154285 RepID=UPI0033A67E03